MIEQLIAIICLIVFCFTGNLELLKICGIFSIASYVSQLKKGDEINDKKRNLSKNKKNK